jgi:hypothetical protein
MLAVVLVRDVGFVEGDLIVGLDDDRPVVVRRFEVFGPRVDVRQVLSVAGCRVLCADAVVRLDAPHALVAVLLAHQFDVLVVFRLREPVGVRSDVDGRLRSDDLLDFVPSLPLPVVRCCDAREG